jgi:putative heme-binding domain-containing protein
VLALCIAHWLTLASPSSAGQKPADRKPDLFARDNLVAWCIVPFDSKKRGPIERVEMLKRLGFRHYAYDWRTEHLPTFDAEVAELQRHDIELTAVWFPALNGEGQQLLDVFKARGIKTQLWVTGGGGPTKSKDEQRQRVLAEAARIRTIAEAAAKIGCTVGLYNHGGWFGEPENQLEILGALKLPNVGLVYNLHHGHDHLERFPKLLQQMIPHLYALNLNGMVSNGERLGRKILPLGTGDLDLGLLKTIRDSGYRGPIGILGHTDDDAELRLLDNLEGLEWLKAQLDGQPAGKKPNYRTPFPAAAVEGGPPPGNALIEGRFGKALDARVARGAVAGKDEYRQPPLTVECWAKLFGRGPYNILVANESKASGTHWELFTMAGSGKLTVYLPGMTPDHVHSDAVITDGQWHHVALVYEPRRIRLHADGKPVSDVTVESKNMPTQPGGLAIGSLVTYEIGCAGLVDDVRLSRGVREIKAVPTEPLEVDDSTLGLWRFDAVQGRQIADEGSLKNPAAIVSASKQVSAGAPPPAGLQHTPVDNRLKATLIDRSENDVFMAVKVDPEGRVFVGGREAVFVFEPRREGGYAPKRELCRFPQDSIIIGLEWRGNDLFVLTNSALYVLPDGRVRRDNLKPRRLLWGLPLDLHVSFHCMAWGPEGDLYLTHGDPLLGYGDWSRPDHWGHWTLHLEPGDRPVAYTGAGAVLQLRLHGPADVLQRGAGIASDGNWRVESLRVLAGGLRGPVGLAFDCNWNLFTNDNDHESLADRYAPARLLHVTPHIDFGWPRGWMASKSPDRADLVETMTAKLGRGVPCDLVYYDDPNLPLELRRRLLMARWDRHSVTMYPLVPRGASFTTEEATVIEGRNNARPVGLGVGGDGRLFVTSLYLAGNVASPYCFSDLIALTAADEADNGHFEPYDPVHVPDARLWAELAGPSWQRRLWAHQEILRRGGRLCDEAADRIARLITARSRRVELAEEVQFNHLVWLTAAARSVRAVKVLRSLAEMKTPVVRWQALRALAYLAASASEAWQPPRKAEAPQESLAAVLTPIFVAGLSDSEPAARLTSLNFFIDTHESFRPAIVAATGRTEDTYLRQTAARLLAQRDSIEGLQSLVESSDRATRLVGVLATGLRLTVPATHDPPPAKLPLFVPDEGAFFKTRIPFADVAEPVNLANAGRSGSYTTAQRWNSEAHTSAQEQCFSLLLQALDDADRKVRLQAAHFLGLLRDPRSEVAVERTRADVLVRDLEPLAATPVERIWHLGPFATADPSATKLLPVEEKAVDLTAGFGDRTWNEVSARNGAFALAGQSQTSASFGYFRVQSAVRQNGLFRAQPGSVAALLHNGRRVSPIDEKSQTGVSTWLLDLEPGSNDFLIRLRHAAAPTSVALRFIATGGLTVPLPEKLDASLLAERLRSAKETDGQLVPSEFIDVNWPERVRSGDVEKGRRLFGTLGCVKCHAIAADQKAGGGPSLGEARRRFTVAHLVESILLPGKQVAETFRATVVVTKSGQTLSGLAVSEDASQIELLLADATRSTISKAEIEESQKTATSPMPAGLVKTVEELQHLLAYLLADNPAPP